MPLIYHLGRVGTCSNKTLLYVCPGQTYSIDVLVMLTLPVTVYAGIGSVGQVISTSVRVMSVTSTG